MSDDDDDEYAAAVHEAGHVVIAQLFDVRCGRVRLFGEGRGLARIYSRDCDAMIARWAAYDRHRTRRDAASIAAMISMGGSCAERLFCDSDGGSDVDQRRVMALAAEWGFSRDELATLWARTRRALRRNAGAVKKLADTLLDRRRLSATQIDQILEIDQIMWRISQRCLPVSSARGEAVVAAYSYGR